jgi:hypothetical protein
LTGAGGRTGRYIVTGEGLLPEGPRNGYAEGGWITPAGYDRLFDGFLFHVLLVSLRPDVDVATGNAALSARIAAAMPEAQGFAFRPPDPPIEVAEIRQVRVLPIALGCFLAVLAVGAVGYALATTVRRRNHEVAVLRALGMTRTQCRGVVATHATLLAVIGVGLGLPMGLALGRTVWRLVAHYTPLQYIAPTATLALVFAAPAALVIANVMAALPSRRAGRLHVAQVLRAE